MARVSLLLMSVCLPVALVSGCSDSSGPAVGNSTAFKPVSFSDQPGPLAVGRMTDVVTYDEQRDRNITATFWYPSEGENAGPGQAAEGAPLISGASAMPLLVLIHGISDSAPATWPWLAPHLASRGYVVVAPSTGSTIATINDFPNHAGDATFLIDVVLGETGHPSPFANRIDRQRIAVAGYSLGSGTAYQLAHDPQYRDNRIVALILMAALGGSAPPVGSLLGYLGLHGTADIAVSYGSGLNIYEAAAPPRYFLTLRGGGHTGFTSSTEFDIGTTMSQPRQESLSRIVITAFLATLFAEDAATRSAARKLLRVEFNEQHLDAEIIFETGD